ncbi:TerB N-terminal domain-containing protein [Collinsella aerofaciens]|uniref:TerB N-terminal domain-containing protein n=1 Tax=Collinsella aerofaciens TaxID=74426 RepID=UPI00232F6980|nr:TerB N-terminal domain-containing protein [Collinsella aerofaciens]MDB1804341.1 TerB N-terminal domain-containing protein [Collinsella aerofaciens]MDB1809174.1 TerB N-terminal domain-containing protein [Collinsella aerofaciens]MDB1810935.1 TerB N-terminal domain-containing protein [Collinsella aerofaciens]
MADQDVKMLIERIMAEARTHQSARFSNKIYADEPILKTGRQMQNFLPDQYRKMREISRWQDDPKGGAGRWLSEAELFYRQGLLMADFEDDCPYNGTFKSYFPTYNAMSDRQLRGYFTWRAQVRRKKVEETSTSFAFLYLYELICGIGVDNPLDGFRKIKAFWESYRAYEPGIDRFARVWLQDYAVFHGLDPKLLSDSKTVLFDKALIELRRAARDIEPLPTPATPATKRRKSSEPTLPLPPDEAREERLMAAINALSTYNLGNSRINHAHHRDLRHVACAVYVRMARYYDTHRKSGIVASLFGEETAMPYTMFASAVFFAPERHKDCEYRLDPIHIYRCQNGFWECMRIHGSRQKSSKLGEMMRACDQRLRLALDPAHPLKEEKVPKYLAKIIDDEIVAWLSWDAAHQPVKIDIDLSQLGHIRNAAAQTREALLIDEEREDDALTEAAEADSGQPEAEPAANMIAEPAAASTQQNEADEPTISTEQFGVVAPLLAPEPTPATPMSAGTASALAHAAEDYLRALLEQNAAQAATAVERSGQSEDMLVDNINEALFDLVGDTVIEFGAAGPQIIEDYEADVRGYLDHE